MEEKMLNICKIMVGCDFSKYSKETLTYAVTLAEKLQADLIIVNVINKREIDTILKVAEGQFDRNIEKYVEKTAQEYETRVKDRPYPANGEINRRHRLRSPADQKGFQSRRALSGINQCHRG